MMLVRDWVQKYGLRVVWGLLLALVIAVPYLLPPRRHLDPVADDWGRRALVLTDDQSWEDVGDSTLAIFGVTGDRDDWSALQYFAGAGVDGASGLIDEPTFKRWRQCIIRRHPTKRCLCREEEWAYKIDIGQWILVNRHIYEADE